MFCIYCGTDLPEDAIFCKRCGKRQDVAENESGQNIAILPFPMPPEAWAGNRQPPIGNVPVVQGTPSVSTNSSDQSLAHSATNNAPSTPLPSAAESSRPLPQAHDTESQERAAEPKLHHQLESRIHSPHSTSTTPRYSDQPASPPHYPDTTRKLVSSDGLKLAGKLSHWGTITIISSLVVIIIVIGAAVIVPKLATHTTVLTKTTKTVTTPTPTPDNILCSGDTSGSPLASGKIDKNHPFHEDDGQAAQGDQGGFTPVTLCNQLAASSYAINLHAKSPYLSLYLYDSKHKKYEIDYNIYPDHISVVTYPGFSLANAISVGEGTYSSADWHTYRIEFTSDFVRVLVDGTQVLSGSAGFTDDGTGDDLLLQSHQITMDQFSITRI